MKRPPVSPPAPPAPPAPPPSSAQLELRREERSEKQLVLWEIGILLLIVAVVVARELLV